MVKSSGKKQNSPFSPYRFCVYTVDIKSPIARLWSTLRTEYSFVGFLFYKPNIFWRCTPISNAKELQINEAIKEKSIRVIGPDGEQLGIMTSEAALARAYDEGYDLVMMAANAEPPVCKIMDYGKYRFECEKREKEARKKQQVVEVKEIQLSYRIDTHDFETKVKHAVRFLTDGNKVRVVLRFKGREMSHVAMGSEIMTKLEEACSEYGTADKKPVLDGRLMSMVLAPIKPAKK